MSKFFVERKDLAVDRVELDSDGLTIGRLIGNDIVLNHPTVSRTHAGIKEVNAEHWIFNLSPRNQTLLNGEQIDKLSLMEGDVLQIGPFFLRIGYIPICHNCGKDFQDESHVVCTNCGTPRNAVAVNVLSIVVELQIAAQPVSIENINAATVLFGMAPMPGQPAATRNGVSRVAGTALLTKFLPPVEEQALEIFWNKRKREAGKIESHFPLIPSTGEKVGKAQFSWRPTLDLRRLWRKSYIAWGTIISCSFSFLALMFYPPSFSPGQVSDAHTRSTGSVRPIAARLNANSCSNCHSIKAMQANCESCHSTNTFSPGISMAHARAGIGCIGCHSEHQGASFRSGFVSSSQCISCHNPSYIYRGKPLGTPHGGTVGYPVQNGKWIWAGISNAVWSNKGLPGDPSKYSLTNQFHLVHFHLGLGRQMKGVMTKCIDCHETGDRMSQRFVDAPKEACAGCHATSFSKQGTNVVGPNCASCHEQHGSRKNLIASARLIGPDRFGGDGSGLITRASVQNVPFSGIGGAEAVRQNRSTGGVNAFVQNFAGVPGPVWIFLIAAFPLATLVALAVNTARHRAYLRTHLILPEVEVDDKEHGMRSINLAKIQREGPKHPYPVVDPVLCIGCHACVEACPHDVLAMVNGTSSAVAPDQCMEDTSCEAECPTQPKACVVLNTSKVIPPRKVPKRDTTYMTNVPGIYIIGDVSGVPLIKMAMNEGSKVIDSVAETLRSEGPNDKAEYDVAIIGVGPGGLSAAAMAIQKGLKYVALEQEKFVSTIQNYPAGKYVFFKPDSVDIKGVVPLPGVGETKETILQRWQEIIDKYQIRIHEEESCKSIKAEDGIFVVSAEKGKAAELSTYNTRKVIIAVGNRGAPMKLGAPGEDLTIVVAPYVPGSVKNVCPDCGKPTSPDSKFCSNCGKQLEQAQLPGKPSQCPNCGTSFDNAQPFQIVMRQKTIAFYCSRCEYRVQELPTEPYNDAKVKYKLSNPDDYVNRKCIVVGGGNSAIEAAVDLCGFKRDGDQINFIRNNEVSLVVRSDYKSDLKLGNKMNIYDCMDAGKVKVYFGAGIQQITEKEVTLINVRSKEVIARLANDYIFALIGSEKPTKFLESVGIKIG